MNVESWFPIKELDCDYSVSSFGRIKNNHTNRILKQRTDKKGYHDIKLKGKTYKVHRLVATAFVYGRTLERNEVNHLDENKSNNCAENLAWVTAKENANWGTRNERRVKHTDYEAMKRSYGYIHRMDNCDTSLINSDKRQPIAAIETGTGNRFEFVSMRDASRKLGVTCGKISECVAGKRKTSNGYKFKRI